MGTLAGIRKLAFSAANSGTAMGSHCDTAIAQRRKPASQAAMAPTTRAQVGPAIQPMTLAPPPLRLSAANAAAARSAAKRLASNTSLRRGRSPQG